MSTRDCKVIMKTLFYFTLFAVVCARFSSEESLSESCEYEHAVRTYFCTGITQRFPNQVYGNFHLKCTDCFIRVFSDTTFPFSNNLVSFNVSSSAIENVTEKAFSNLRNVQYFYLHNNHIVNIDAKAFYGLSQVYEIHLENNELKHLTPGFVDHLEANTIYLNNNKITAIPENVFDGLVGLISIDLSFNNISHVFPQSFNHLDGLEILNLQHNNLCSLPLDLFKPIETLRHLNLAYNKLRKFATGAFSSLQNLGHLNLTGNNLIDFDGSILLPMSRISVVDIANNGLYYFDPHSIHLNAPTLRQFRIDDNLFSCTLLTNMIQFFRKNNVHIVNSVKRYDMQNINGIACTEKVVSEKIDFEVFLKIVEAESKKNVDWC